MNVFWAAATAVEACPAAGPPNFWEVWRADFGLAPVMDTAMSARTLTAYEKAWSDLSEPIDLQLSPLGSEAMKCLHLNSGDTVIDVGCGTGQTLIQLAKRVGPRGRVIGVDISPGLLDIARQRSAAWPQVTLIEGDAEHVPIGAASADAVFSRFGVMAFTDPVAAFANLRRILKSRGTLAFCCWRSLAENELDRLPLEAAGFAVADETPFSLADSGHLRRTLGAAGFGEIVIRAHDQKVSSGDLDAMTSVLCGVGALGKVVRDTPNVRGEAEPRLRQALADLGDPSCVELRAAIWIVTAVA